MGCGRDGGYNLMWFKMPITKNLTKIKAHDTITVS